MFNDHDRSILSGKLTPLAQKLDYVISTYTMLIKGMKAGDKEAILESKQRAAMIAVMSEKSGCPYTCDRHREIIQEILDTEVPSCPTTAPDFKIESLIELFELIIQSSRRVTEERVTFENN